MGNVRLPIDPRLAHTSAAKAATEAADLGLSPRAQIDAARAKAGARLVYLPHQGQRERERMAARMAKAAAKGDAS